MMLVAYAACGCRTTALLTYSPDERVEFEEEARNEGWTVREEEHEAVGARPCPQHADCTCAAIQAADSRRHFKGCLKREDLPERDQAAIDEAAANLRAIQERSVSEVMQDDMAHLLRTLGLSDHARPESPHVVMVDEVIPEVLRLRKDSERLDEYRQRIQTLEREGPRGPLRLVCPKCAATHERGPMNGVDVYRCLKCGWTGRWGWTQAEPAPMDCDCQDEDAMKCALPGAIPGRIRCGCPHHRVRPPAVCEPGDTSGPNVHVALKQRGLELAERLAQPMEGRGPHDPPGGVHLDERKELLFIVRHLLG